MVRLVLFIVLAAGLGVAVPGHAGAIYQCEENGRKVFSQQPCGADAKVVKTDANRTVEMSAAMSGADIGYLCSLAMRSWERVAAEARNRRAANSYHYYGSSSGESEKRRRAFVLSHISNLERIAANDPELYDVAKSLSYRQFSGDPDSYTYDAERARAEKDCVHDVQLAIERLQRRYKDEDERRFGKRK